MLYVKLTQDQANRMPVRTKGYAGCYLLNGKRVKEEIIFCSSLDFLRHIGVEEEKILIEI